MIDGLTYETIITSTGDMMTCRFYHARGRYWCHINGRRVTAAEYLRAKRRDLARVRRS